MDRGMQYWQQLGQQEEMRELWDKMMQNEQFLKEYNLELDRCENERIREVTES